MKWPSDKINNAWEDVINCYLITAVSCCCIIVMIKCQSATPSCVLLLNVYSYWLFSQVQQALPVTGEWCSDAGCPCTMSCIVVMCCYYHCYCCLNYIIYVLYYKNIKLVRRLLGCDFLFFSSSSYYYYYYLVKLFHQFHSNIYNFWYLHKAGLSELKL